MDISGTAGGTESQRQMKGLGSIAPRSWAVTSVRFGVRGDMGEDAAHRRYYQLSDLRDEYSYLPQRRHPDRQGPGGIRASRGANQEIHGAAR